MAENTKTPDLGTRSVAEMVRQARRTGRPWLRMRGLDLTEVPEEIFTLKDVEVIDLSGNKLRSIPEQLWDLPKLRQVRLLGNPIETLSNRSGDLRQILEVRELHVRNG